LIADLDRIVHILDCDIATEEDPARVSDHSDAAYPMLARTLAARRKHLKVTIAALERRLEARQVSTIPPNLISDFRAW
jgi:hypothetical protein